MSFSNGASEIWKKSNRAKPLFLFLFLILFLFIHDLEKPPNAHTHRHHHHHRSNQLLTDGPPTSSALFLSLPWRLLLQLPLLPPYAEPPHFPSTPLPKS
uniref:Uncharacterized protein n=1 Tax=Kalanchoe fedtschenkoi TaxID=63787 RepID=A0A7N0SW10_KALFE